MPLKAIDSHRLWLAPIVENGFESFWLFRERSFAQRRASGHLGRVKWEAGLMNFWWATQTTNYPQVIAKGTLWTCPRGQGKPLKESRRLIKDLRVGDIVFHYQAGFLRAVSTVTGEWQDYPRPAEYARREGEADEGWLVSVEPVTTGLDLDFRRVGELINKGNGGPLGSNGIPAQKYLSRLSQEEGVDLLAELKVILPIGEDGLLGRPPGFWDGDETDSQVLRKIRKEQADLRRGLLQGRASADCSICGALLPASLLIAGHIKPRSTCTDEERRDYNSAMLVCNLGCDAMFEWGYVVVDGTGRVRASRTPETTAVKKSSQASPAKSVQLSTVIRRRSSPSTLSWRRNRGPVQELAQEIGLPLTA